MTTPAYLRRACLLRPVLEGWAIVESMPGYAVRIIPSRAQPEGTIGFDISETIPSGMDRGPSFHEVLREMTHFSEYSAKHDHLRRS